MEEGQKSECNCEFGSVDEETVAMVRDMLKPGESLDEKLKLFRKRDCDSRTGHFPGCPVDVQAYNPGEFYCNCALSWANSFLISRSRGMLRTGPVNTEDPDYEMIQGVAGMTGVYRKEDSQ
jgi:hypothetical protein